MSHARTQIRDALATLLTGLSTTGAHVFKSRVRQLAQNELPALVVFTANESITPLTPHPNHIDTRELDIAVTGYAQVKEDIEDRLDQIALEVEQVINATESANTLGGLVDGLQLQSIKPEIVGEGERLTGQLSMIFNCSYRVSASAPQTIL